MEIKENVNQVLVQQSKSSPNATVAPGGAASSTTQNFMALFSQIINGSMVTLDFLQAMPQQGAKIETAAQEPVQQASQPEASKQPAHAAKKDHKDTESTTSKKQEGKQEEVQEQVDNQTAKQEVASEKVDPNAAAQAAPVEQQKQVETNAQTQQQVTSGQQQAADPKAAQAALVQQLPVAEQQTLTPQQVQNARAKVLTAQPAQQVATQPTQATTTETALPTEASKVAPTVKPVATTEVLKPQAPQQPTAKLDVTAAAVVAAKPTETVVPTVTPKVSAEDFSRMIKSPHQIAASSGNNSADNFGGKSGLFGGQSGMTDLDLGGLGNGGNSAKTARNSRHAGHTEALPEKTQAEIIERIQKMMDSATKTRFGSTMVVRLDPPELGAVTVKITQRSDQLFAKVTPENPDVEAVLRARAGEITQILGNTGLKAENIHLSIGGDVSDSEAFAFNSFMNGNEGSKGQLGSDSNHAGSDFMASEKLGNGLNSGGFDSGNLESGWVA